ncbi:MAG: hypothetical protein JSV14_05900, partial [Deltaproteobacteria bacterium]
KSIADLGMRIAELEISPLFELLLISIQNPKSAIRNVMTPAHCRKQGKTIEAPSGGSQFRGRSR